MASTDAWYDYSCDIPSNARYVRVANTGTGATGSKQIRNVKVTRLTSLSANNSGLSFDITKIGKNASRTISVSYSNTYSGAVLTGTCSNPAFTVTQENMGETGTKNITVTYTPTALGVQTGTVTLTMGTAGKNNNTTCQFTVSGTGTIDYLFSATAGANMDAFGSASVTFDNVNSGISAEASELNTTSASVNKTATFTATPNPGYEFVGWGTTSGATSYESTENPNEVEITASQSAPNQSKTLYAIFKPVFNFAASAVSSNGALGTAGVSLGNSKIVGDVDDTQAGTTATFVATPAENCIFKGWFESSSYEGVPVSTDATYPVGLTNVAIGSTASKTLYASFKKKQNLQWADADLDLNLVNGQSYSSVATVTSGKTITYFSGNQNAVNIDTDGTIHAVGLGDSRVTASVEGVESYDAETITRDFSVGEIKQATFAPVWGEGTSTDIKVDGSTSVGLTNIANDATFTVTASPEGIVSWNREGNTLAISAVSAGTTTLTLSQQGNASLAGITANYTITVSKYANTFALADETKAMKVGDVWENIVTNVGNNNTQVSYSVEGVASYDAGQNKITAVAEGSTIITFTQESTADHEGIVKTVSVTASKINNTLNVTLPTLEVNVGGTIVLSESGRISDGATHALIADQQLSSTINNGTDVISYANGVITAQNAGTAKITFIQDATDRYTAYTSETYLISVSKVSNAITVTLDGEKKNSLNVARGVQVALGYTSNSDAEYLVSLTSGSEETATITGNTITAGSTDGTNIWIISQDETYKYEAATTSVRIKVNSVAEQVGYVLVDTPEHNWSTISSYTPDALSGPGDVLTFEASKSNLGVNYFYVMYSTDGGQKYKELANPDLSGNWQSFSYSLPDGVTNIKFESRTGATFSKYVRNIYVTRRTYVKASPASHDLGTVYTDKTATAEITVNYSSTNGGNIEVVSSNPHYVVDTEVIEVVSNARAGKRVDFMSEPHLIDVQNNTDKSVIVKVTYTPDPDQLGEDNAVITVSDLFYSAEVNLTAVAAKASTSISRGTNTSTSTQVDGVIDNVFAFTGTSASVPSSDTSDDFYYTISHTQTSSVNNGEGVISYDPASNTIAGLNAGTARLTIYQKSTLLYSATSQTFDFTVSKIANNTKINLGLTVINVDGISGIELTDDDSKGAITAEFSNVAFVNAAQNREGGLLAFDELAKTLTGVNAGTATVTITQAETYKYLSKTQQFNVTVNKLAQTLTWDDADLETTMQKGATLLGNTATSAEGLTPVAYSSSNTAAIEVDAVTGVLTAVNTGANITITATQAGNYKYAPASITRQFSVFNKQTPSFDGDDCFSGAAGRVELEGTATITVRGVGADASEGFEFTNGNPEIINVVRDSETITITGLKTGTATLTLSQAASDDFIAKTQVYNIEVYVPADFITLDPSVAPDAPAGLKRKVTLNRTLKAGYSTIALPFDLDVTAISPDAWVAQLSVVSYNANDGYSLYFSKSTQIKANEPYILHLDAEVVNPLFLNVETVVAEQSEHSAEKGTDSDGHSYTEWSMKSNYTPAFDMEGLYGVAGNVIRKGATGATVNAYSAYIEGPSTAAAVRTAYIDGNVASGLTELLGSTQAEDEYVYDLQGRRMDRSATGISIVRKADGRVLRQIVR